MPEASAPAVPRPAATVMVVRPSDGGFEVFMVRRPQASRFAANVFVFPGGTVRADDRLTTEQAREVGLDPDALHAILAEHQDPFAEQEDGGLSLWVAALRELFEEAGVLLAEGADGQLLDLSAPDRAERFTRLRTELQEGTQSLLAVARAEGLSLAADRLTYFSRWITPVTSPRRYDTRFFLAELPGGQVAAHCQIETTDGLWVVPSKALARNGLEEFPLMFVTREHVRRLSEFPATPELLEFARTKRIHTVRADLDERDEPYLTPEQRRSW